MRYREVSGYLVGSAAFKAVGMGDPHPAGSIPVHLRHEVHGCSVGRPTGRTRALAIASRDRHIAKLAEDAKFASSLAGGFTAESTVAELTEWWLQNIARHRVRATTFAT